MPDINVVIQIKIALFMNRDRWFSIEMNVDVQKLKFKPFKHPDAIISEGRRKGISTRVT